MGRPGPGERSIPMSPDIAPVYSIQGGFIEGYCRGLSATGSGMP